MSTTITIDESRRLTLPLAIREKFNLAAGSLLRIKSTGDRFELTPVAEDETSLVERDGLLAVSATGMSCDAREAVELEREGR